MSKGEKHHQYDVLEDKNREKIEDVRIERRGKGEGAGIYLSTVSWMTSCLVMV